MSPYDDLPEDNYEAFLHLEAAFREDFEERSESPSISWEYLAFDYINKSLAAAQALEITPLQSFQAAHSTGGLSAEDVGAFKRAVDSIVVQAKIQRAKRNRASSVGFSSDQKAKIHAFIQKIRDEVERSSAQIDKKEKLFAILSKLSKEVDRPRTAMERFTELGMSLATLSRSVEREGAQPWWPWFQKLLSLVGDAKEAEPSLPPPPEIRKIEPPKRGLPKPSSSDDDIPF